VRTPVWGVIYEAKKSSGAEVWQVKEHFTPYEYEYMYEYGDVYKKDG